jgi:hypothetical protein
MGENRSKYSGRNVETYTGRNWKTERRLQNGKKNIAKCIQ